MLVETDTNNLHCCKHYFWLFGAKKDCENFSISYLTSIENKL